MPIRTANALLVFLPALVAACDCPTGPSRIDFSAQSTLTHCRTRALLLWLPFRREKLRPAPDAGFSNLQPCPDGIVDELARRDDLRPLVAGLRHVESIEIRNRGRMCCAVHLVDANQRLLGPERWSVGVRSFSGTVGTKPDGTRAHFSRARGDPADRAPPRIARQRALAGRNQRSQFNAGAREG